MRSLNVLCCISNDRWIPARTSCLDHDLCIIINTIWPLLIEKTVSQYQIWRQNAKISLFDIPLILKFQVVWLNQITIQTNHKVDWTEINPKFELWCRGSLWMCIILEDFNMGMWSNPAILAQNLGWGKLRHKPVYPPRIWKVLWVMITNR